jgi:hypothetical protein
LKELNLYGFTIDSFVLYNTESLEYLGLEDVSFINNIYLPKLKKLKAQNFFINPLNFKINKFKIPNIEFINCLIYESFVYNKLQTLCIQCSTIEIQMIHLLKKHKNLKNVYFYHNNYDKSINITSIKQYIKK